MNEGNYDLTQNIPRKLLGGACSNGPGNDLLPASERLQAGRLKYPAQGNDMLGFCLGPSIFAA